MRITQAIMSNRLKESGSKDQIIKADFLNIDIQRGVRHETFLESMQAVKRNVIIPLSKTNKRRQMGGFR